VFFVDFIDSFHHFLVVGLVLLVYDFLSGLVFLDLDSYLGSVFPAEIHVFHHFLPDLLVFGFFGSAKVGYVCHVFCHHSPILKSFWIRCVLWVV